MQDPDISVRILHSIIFVRKLFRLSEFALVLFLFIMAINLILNLVVKRGGKNE